MNYQENINFDSVIFSNNTISTSDFKDKNNADHTTLRCFYPHLMIYEFVKLKNKNYCSSIFQVFNNVEFKTFKQKMIVYGKFKHQNEMFYIDGKTKEVKYINLINNEELNCGIVNYSNKLDTEFNLDYSKGRMVGYILFMGLKMAMAANPGLRELCNVKSVNFVSTNLRGEQYE